MARHGRRAFAAAVLAVLALLAAGCDNSEVEVPSSLLTAKTVGGTPVAGAARSAGSAGPETISLLAGSATDTAGYRRTRGGDEELVLIGAWERSASLVRSGMTDLSECLDTQKCGHEPLSFEAARLGGQPEGTVAFSSVFTNKDDERVSVKRSYTYLQPEPNFDGTLVMVSIQRTGGSDPSDQELKRLTEAQVAKTKATLTKAEAQSS